MEASIEALALQNPIKIILSTTPHRSKTQLSSYTRKGSITSHVCEWKSLKRTICQPYDQLKVLALIRFIW